MVREQASTRVAGKLASVSAMLLAAVIFALTATLPTCAWAQNAKAMYAEKCEMCHGAAGKGDGPAGKSLTPPPGDFAATLKGKSDEWISKAIKEGGPAVGKAATMPGYGDLTDQQLKELVDYIKKL
jgi:mono/diheme cytochrome c family protein